MRLFIKLILGISVLILAIILWMGISHAEDECVVTNLDGGFTPGSLYFNVVLSYDEDCDLITFDPALTGTIRLTNGISVRGNTRIKGETDSNGNPKVTVKGASGLDVAYLILLRDRRTATSATIENLKIEYASTKTGILIRPDAAGHWLKNVHVAGNNIGIDVDTENDEGQKRMEDVVVHGNNTGIRLRLDSNGNILRDVLVRDNDVGIQVRSDRNKINTSTFRNNLEEGILIEGSYNEVLESAIHHNGNGGLIVDDGDFNKISETEFYNNSGLGIALINGGNFGSTPPQDMRALFQLGDTQIGLYGWVENNVSRVEIFFADSNNQEGEEYLLAASGSDIKSDWNGDGRRLFVKVIDYDTLNPGERIVTTSIYSNKNTSEFSAALLPDYSRRLDGDPACFEVDWFLRNLDQHPTNPWKVTSPNGETYLERDPDHDCVLDEPDGGREGGEEEPPPVDTGTECLNACAGITNPLAWYECILTRCSEEGGRCAVSATDPTDANRNGIPDSCDTDTDGDGLPDYLLDNCPFIPNTDQANNDGDGQGDVCDDDDDNDGLPDTLEEGDEFGTEPGDPDSDNDGYCDGRGVGYGTVACMPGDNCPEDYNPQQRDRDNDSIGDGCDAEPMNPCSMGDSDGDGIHDFDFNSGTFDNCPAIYNPQQTDSDNDGTGDACDPDDDNDGLRDDVENSSAWYYATVYATVASGMTQRTLDEMNPDSDGDGYCDGPCADSDGNGACDGLACAPSDNCPLTFVDIGADGQQDYDNDGIGDFCDMDYRTTGGFTDSDSDGVADHEDNCLSAYNRRRTFTSPQGDIDRDSRGDACDTDSDGDGSGDVFESGSNMYAWWTASDAVRADPSIDPRQVCLGGPDRDGDGVPDIEGGDNCAPPADDDQAPGKSNSYYNPDQLDMDGDGIGDTCEAGCGDDIDGDGSENCADNCRFLYNPGQEDSDTDDVGDNCDTDALPDMTVEPYAPLYAFQGGGGTNVRGSQCSLIAGRGFDYGAIISLFLIGAAVFIIRRRRQI